MEIIPLSELAPEQLATRNVFDCGDASLNSYLADTARQHYNKNVTRTFCFMQHGCIVGYFTLANAGVRLSGLDPGLTKRLRLGGHELPVVRLCRLAVSTSHQKQGIGRLLLMDALLRTKAIAQSSGCVGLLVDAKNEDAATYYAQFGFRRPPSGALTLLMPLGDINQLLTNA